MEALAAVGRKVHIIWECDLRNESALRTSLKAFLGASGGEDKWD
jgi:G:T-mismatch repair DNA endonuclease (very short patch repair protein)